MANKSHKKFSEMNAFERFEYHYIREHNKWVKQTKKRMEDHEMNDNVIHINNDTNLNYILEAHALYGKDECFVCNTKLKWFNETLHDDNGRMYLNKGKWFSLCIKCLRDINIQNNRDEIIKEKYKESLIEIEKRMDKRKVNYDDIVTDY